jgi:hypothetical protein
MDFVNIPKYQIVICVYACATIEKYREQIRMVRNTWGQLCNVDDQTPEVLGVSTDVLDLVRNRVKLIFFLGEEFVSDEFARDDCVLLPNVRDDYLSASYKQYGGLKHIYTRYRADFVMCCGTDTYINIPSLVKFAERYSPNDNLYIGGHGCHRTIGDRSYYFHSGGPGFLLSRNCLGRLFPLLAGDIVEDWLRICSENAANDPHDLTGACDVSISFYLQQTNITAQLVIDDELRFLNCNYMGSPCHPGQTDHSKIISCHLMSDMDFAAFTAILKQNNFFVHSSSQVNATSGGM